jgi:hypothetical protein
MAKCVFLSSRSVLFDFLTGWLNPTSFFDNNSIRREVNPLNNLNTTAEKRFVVSNNRIYLERSACIRRRMHRHRFNLQPSRCESFDPIEDRKSYIRRQFSFMYTVMCKAMCINLVVQNQNVKMIHLQCCCCLAAMTRRKFR